MSLPFLPRRLRWKIIAPYAALTIMLAVAGTYLVTRLVGGSLDERFNNQLAEAGRVAQDAIVRHERKHLEAVRAVAFTDGVGAAVTAGDTAQLSALIEPLLANAGLERAEVIGADGLRLYGQQITDRAKLTYAPILDDPRTPGSWTFVQTVLAGQNDSLGDKYTEIVNTPSQEYVLYTAGPIYEGDLLVGAVLIGTTLPSFMSAAKSESLARCHFLRRLGRRDREHVRAARRGHAQHRAERRCALVQRYVRQRTAHTVWTRL